MSQETAELYASHMMALASQARAAIRDLDPKVESTHTSMYMCVHTNTYTHTPTLKHTYVHIYIHIYIYYIHYMYFLKMHTHTIST
jgi:hypothetical protein